jgi:hypothetical protein
MLASSRKMVEDLGITHRLLEADVFAGLIELLEGDGVAAERSLRPAYDGLREQGLAIDAAQAGALLGRALLALDRAADAEAVSYESEALAGDDLKAAIAWRGVRAEALARRGEHATATELALAAVDLAAATDALLDHADARLSLAAALRAAGRGREAAAEEARAIELWEAKGATVLAERARKVGVRVEVPRAPADRSAAARAARRVVRTNAATAHQARIDAALAARDTDALRTLHAETCTVDDHVNGVVYDVNGLLASWRGVARTKDLTYRTEPLATLGDSLLLVHESTSGVPGGELDAGVFETQRLGLLEVDAEGRAAQWEVFPQNGLADAIVRLYERYAALLPDGPERERAAERARRVATIFDPSRRVLDTKPSESTPPLEFVDHRPLGFPPTRSYADSQERTRSLFDLATDVDRRVDDVLRVEPHGLLVRCTQRGTVRASGGAFESRFLMLFRFGHVPRGEMFAEDADDEALARFAELEAEATAMFGAERGRRVRPNAATANVARFDAAIRARDTDALRMVLAEQLEVTEYATRTTFGLEGTIATLRGYTQRAQNPIYRSKVLATLGDSLTLHRSDFAASGFASATLDVGPYEVENVVVTEVDDRERRTRDDVFAPDRLGEAVIRLYERHAELVPDGPERARAAATAQSVTRILDPLTWRDDRLPGSSYASDVEFVDHRPFGFPRTRGAEEFLQRVVSLFELAEDVVIGIDDVLRVEPNGFLLSYTNRGTVRASGGAYERRMLMLWVFGPDGRVTRNELFPEDGDAEALARFAELMGEPTAPPSPARDRGVRPNAATANMARFDAAMLNRAGFSSVFSERMEVLDHTTGTTFGVEGWLATLRWWMERSQNVVARSEILATLGESLGLLRTELCASGYSGATVDVGPFESTRNALVEVDEQGRRTRHELFAEDRLGDAVARLYARYAELLPDGPARARAAATARSYVALSDPIDLDRLASALDPAHEFVDHRPLGLPSYRGAEPHVRSVRILVEASTEICIRVDDILRLREDACLLRWTQLGVMRNSGGAYERPLLVLFCFGPDGRGARCELFATDREAEALARFDELTGPTVTVAMARDRRVRPNAATANIARVVSAALAGDADAFRAVLADEVDAIDHTIGTTLSRAELISMFDDVMQSRNLTSRSDVLATLGETLALARVAWAASGFASATVDVGAMEGGRILLVEVDEQGRRTRHEFFGEDKLYDAVARLYERYAETLPDGPERVRAAATARAYAAIGHLGDRERYRSALDPAIEFLDYRPLGLPSRHGAEQVVEGTGTLVELSTDVDSRVDDVLRLRPTALLVRWTQFGTLRAGGGAYERHALLLTAFGPSGLVNRIELFAPDRETEACARFDELMGEGTAAPARRRARLVRPNAATARTDRMAAIFAARDAEALAGIVTDDYETVHHPTRAVWGRQEALRDWRALIRAEDPVFLPEILATLGASLALFKLTVSAKGVTHGEYDVGPYERPELVLIEVDPTGRGRRSEQFGSAGLGPAVVRLYERYAELLPDGPERDRAAATARSVAALLGSADFNRWATVFAEDIECRDHRVLATFSARGEAVLEQLRSWDRVAENVTFSMEDVLALEADALLIRWTFSGTDRQSGGVFERPHIVLMGFGSTGLLARLEPFDVDRDAEALARFSELTAAALSPIAVRSRRRRVRPNAATAMSARLDAAVAARDEPAAAALIADAYEESVDHTAACTYDGRGTLDNWLIGMRVPGMTFRHESLATLGESIELSRVALSAPAMADERLDVGPFENELVVLVEVDANARQRRAEIFPLSRLGDAVVRLYERYADELPDGPTRDRAATTARSVAAFLDPKFPTDLARVVAALDPATEFVDHRPLGFPTLRGVDQYRARMQTLLDLSTDVTNRIDDVLRLEPNGFLVHWTQLGTASASGGAYERLFLSLGVFGPDGLAISTELFASDQGAEALARFAELTAVPAAVKRRIRPNAATEIAARLDTAVAARDLDAIAALLADDVRAIEHPTDVVYDRAGILYSYRVLLAARDPMSRAELLASLGDSLALGRVTMSAREFSGSRLDVGPYERVYIRLTEADADGRCRLYEAFAEDRLDDALARLYARHAELLPEGPARARAAAIARTVADNGGPFEPERFAPTYAPGIEAVDHRILGSISARGAEGVLAHIRAWLEVAEGLTVRADDILALEPDALLKRATLVGIDRAGGGAFERESIQLMTFGSDGLMTRFEWFDADGDGQALARFDELKRERAAPVPSHRPDPLCIPRNAATRASDRWTECIRTEDWEALRMLVAPILVEDRRRLIRTTGGCETAIANSRLQRGRAKRTLLATAGDRLALQHVRWTGTAGGDAGAYEIELLEVWEVDAEGRVLATVGFDPDDRRAASTELLDRHARAMGLPVEAFHAVNDHDLERFRATLTDDFVFHDHRRTGVGRLDGPDAYVASIRPLFEEAPDFFTDNLYIVAQEQHGSLAVARTFGTLRTGGEFESVFVRMMLSRGDRIAALEQFELEELDVARARFEALRTLTAA